MIFFDIDATLLDHNRAESMAAKDFFELHNKDLTYTKNEFILEWNCLSDTYFTKFLAKELSFQEQRRMRIKHFLGLGLSNYQADCIFDEYLDLYQKNWMVYNDVISCLTTLKKQGHSLGIITNGDYDQQIEKLNYIGIRQYFDCVVTSSKAGIAKPNTEIFEAACRQAEVEITDCYYIGDRVDTDAIASTKAGMKGIWLNRKNKETHSDVMVIHDLNELEVLVRGIS